MMEEQLTLNADSVKVLEIKDEQNAQSLHELFQVELAHEQQVNQYQVQCIGQNLDLFCLQTLWWFQRQLKARHSKVEFVLDTKVCSTVKMLGINELCLGQTRSEGQA